MDYTLHFLILGIFLIFILVVIFDFRGKTENILIDLDQLPLLSSLPDVVQYQVCYDPWGNLRLDTWYNQDQNITISTVRNSNQSKIVAKNAVKYVYEFGQGKIGCFPQS